MANTEEFEQKLNAAIEKFTAKIVEALKGASVEELVELSQHGTVGTVIVGRLQEQVEKRLRVAMQTPTKHRREAATKTIAKEKPRKKRSWPTCSAPGCSKKMYGPRGKPRLCYRHHLEAGGKPASFARKKAVPAKEERAKGPGVSPGKLPQPDAKPEVVVKPESETKAKPEATTMREGMPRPRSKGPRKRAQAEIPPTVVVRKRNGDASDTGGPAVKAEGPAHARDARKKAEALFGGLS